VTLSSIITRTATIALAAGALAAPTASARPAETPPAAAKAASADQHKQARGPVSASTQSKQDPIADIHAPLARVAAANARAQDPARRRLPGPPTWPVNPQPITPAHAVNNPASSGVNPTTIGLGIAGSLLAIAGVAGLARRSRRVQRTRVTA
jgi:hypothetical protein